jgi:hypothetical protein
MHIVRSNKAKPEQLILNKSYPTKVTVNSRLLDMQGYNSLSDLVEAATKCGSLLSIFNLNILAILIIHE